MCVHLRHPGAVPALFSREAEMPSPGRGIARLWRRVVPRPLARPTTSLSVAARPPGWFAVSLLLLAAETPLIQAAESLLATALPH